MKKKQTSHHFLILVTLLSSYFVLLAGMLAAGLWPFNFLPKNRVYFDSQSHCLLFKNPSIAVIKNFPDGTQLF